MASDDRAIPERKRAREALRAIGFSARQADALLKGGWKAVVGETEAEAAELRDELAKLELQLRGDPVL